MSRKCRVFVPIIFAATFGSVVASDSVALRTADGRFVRAHPDGHLRPVRKIPSRDDTFELERIAPDRIALKTRDGRVVVAQGPQRRTLRAVAVSPETPAGEPFWLVPVDAHRTAMRAGRAAGFVVFGGEPVDSSGREDPPKPVDGELVEIFRVSNIPTPICVVMETVIVGLLNKELADEEYRKIRTKKREEYVRVPAPTLRDPLRTKKRRVLSISEEYHVSARLDGTPEIHVDEMPLLRGFQNEGSGLLMFAVRASLPISGRVRYRIPKALSASTGFVARVHFSSVGEVRTEKSSDAIGMDPPEIVDLQVELESLTFSNDVLQVVRREIRALANREIHDRRNKLRQKANRELAKAVRDHRFKHPLFRHLTAP